MVPEKNLYLPVKTTIHGVKELSKDVRLFSIVLPEGFSYQPGQFVMVSVLGVGEIPISITSTPGVSEHLEICVRTVGHVSSAVNRMKTGDTILIRGAYGKPFPINGHHRDTLFICGGIGIVPLRPLIHQIVNAHSRACRKGTVAVIYGSRNPSEVLFKEEVAGWMNKGVNVVMTVDRCDIESWTGCVGLVTEHFDKAGIDYKNCTAYLCGPHVMIQAAMRDLSLMGMPDDRIITTLEAHMKCGVGKCGHCYCGGKLICEEGPVFSLEEMKRHHMKPGVDSLA